MTSQLWTRSRVLFVRLGIATVLAYGIAFLTMRVGELEPDYTGLQIPYDYLANEENDPFMIGSRRGPPTVDEWRRPIESFADVRDCLIVEQREAETPDLRRIDWAQVRGSKARSVCVWRIFSSLGSPERSAKWLAAQGFRVSGPDAPDRLGEVWLSGNYNPSIDGVLLPGGSLIGRWLSQKVVYAEGVTARWGEDDRLISVGVSASVE